jgi:hypothetical protein
MIGAHQYLSGHLAGDQPGETMDASITEPNSITADIPVKPQRRRHSLAFKQQVIAEGLISQHLINQIRRIFQSLNARFSYNSVQPIATEKVGTGYLHVKLFKYF